MVERSVDPHPLLIKEKPGLYMEMGVTAEVVARRYGIPREAQDEYALASQQRTARAQREGFFSEEIAPMQVTMKTPERVRAKSPAIATSATGRTHRSKAWRRLSQFSIPQVR